MFFFPLGLVAKLDRLPFFSILIVGITVAYSILCFPELDRFYEEKLLGDQQKKLVKARLQLLSSQCSVAELDKETCTKLNETLKEYPKHEGLPLLKKVARNIATKENSAHLRKVMSKDKFWVSQKDQLSQVPEYKSYQAALDDYQLFWSNRNKKTHHLSRNSLQWTSVLKAQFTHAGWMHLIGNMVFLLLLIPFVEQRIGPLKTMAIYGLTGAIGLTGHLLFETDPSRTILGASANVFGIAGAFLVLFFRKSIKVWASYLFFINKKIMIPCWIYFAFFVVASEVQGLVNEYTNVAHDAHLIAMIVGAGIGYVFLKKSPVSEPMVYPYEEKLYLQSQSCDGPKKMGLLTYLIDRNPENHLALQDLLFEFNRRHIPWKKLKKWHKLGLVTAFKSALGQSFVAHSKTQEEVDKWLSLWPTHWPIEPLILKEELPLASSIIEYFKLSGQGGKADQLIQAYRAFLAPHQQEVFDRTINEKLARITGHEQPAV